MSGDGGDSSKSYTAQADLDTYRSQYGLPACGSGCFTKVNQNGAASPLPSAAGTTGWDVEEALDIDMVSAICPLCHITLVEANSNSDIDLYTAENSAVSLSGKFISNSWGGSEYSGETADANTYFNIRHRGRRDHADHLKQLPRLGREPLVELGRRLLLL